MKTIAFLNNEVQENMKGSGMTFMGMGYANGYVAIPPGHPLHGMGYDSVDIEAWGGLTFAASKSELDQWDGSHVEMLDGGSLDDIPADWWIFGFDTMNYGDGPEHDRNWCIAETRRLQKQLED